MKTDIKEDGRVMVEILEETGELVIRIGGQEYARYQFGLPRWKPYLYPLRAANGLSLLANAPTDHRNHHGFWVGHGRVGETDCWLERHNSGKIVHEAFERLVGGDEMGSFIERCNWEGVDGEIVLKDVRTFTFYDMPSEGRVFDFEISLQAPAASPVTLNSAGKRNERDTYRQKASWMDCSGKLGRLACGVALFDHPENPDYPSRWFTRDYGTFSPNYAFFEEEPLLIEPEKPLRLRYRVFTHSGDAEAGGVQQAWETYYGSSGVTPHLTLR
jgi:hypothetical protein